MVHESTDPYPPEDDWTDPIQTDTFTVVNVSVNPPHYLTVRAVDVNGNQSPMSAILRTSDQKWVVLADDRHTLYEYPMEDAAKLRSTWSTNHGVSRFIQGKEVIEDLVNGHVVKSVRFRCYTSNNLEADETWMMSGGRVILAYAVANGDVVQGSPDRIDYFSGLYGFNSTLRAFDPDLRAEDNSVAAQQGLQRIGQPVIHASGATGKLSMFWYNGARWVKVGGTLDTANQTLSYESTRMGVFQIRQATQLGDVSLVQVYPRVFTPNGDGANDVVIFQFGEGDVTGVSFQGDVFDVAGAKVGSLKPGPDSGTLMWDGKTSSGATVPSGIYVYQITAGGKTVNGTVVVAR
jgi:hypothetical protein